jgi:hypothetical protein
MHGVHVVVLATSVSRIYHYASEMQFWCLTRSEFRKAVVSTASACHQQTGTGEISIDDITCLLNKVWHIQELQKKSFQLYIGNKLAISTDQRRG